MINNLKNFGTVDPELKIILGPCIESLSISGDWTNAQYTGSPVDYTGLTFTVTYNNGTTASVTPTSISPSVWGSTEGEQTCTFTYEENKFRVSASKSASVEMKTLNQYTWSEIKSIADAGTAGQYWSVGDYKEVSVAAGTVDQMSVVAGTYRAVIIGINHNPTYENPNSIDFAIGQNTSSTDIIFYNSTGVRMNMSNVTTGGWTGSQMYLIYLPQFYNLLSGNTGLQSAMIAPKKWTNNVGGGSGADIEANVTLSENASYKMFLMAEYEILGTRTYANSYEQNKQMQYAYYSSSGLAKSKKRYKTDTGAAYYWWERSALCTTTSTGYFCYVNRYGDASGSGANSAYGLCPCFRV